MAITESMRDERIEAERLEAADSEWQRHHRVSRALLVSLDRALADWRALAKVDELLEPKSVQHIIDLVEGVAEVLRGEWIVAPKEMQARRQTKAHKESAT